MRLAACLCAYRASKLLTLHGLRWEPASLDPCQGCCPLAAIQHRRRSSRDCLKGCAGAEMARSNPHSPYRPRSASHNSCPGCCRADWSRRESVVREVLLRLVTASAKQEREQALQRLQAAAPRLGTLGVRRKGLSVEEVCRRGLAWDGLQGLK